MAVVWRIGNNISSSSSSSFPRNLSFQKCSYSSYELRRSCFSDSHSFVRRSFLRTRFHRHPLELPISCPKQLFERLLNKEDLNEEEAEGSLDFLLSDGTEAVISAFLVLLRAKCETYEEIVGMARAMIKCCKKVEGMENAVDIVGTGGDGANTVNISTGAAILAAACGARVAKVDALEEHFSAYGELSSVELEESPQDNTNDASVSSSSNVSARVSFASRHFAEKAFSHGKSWKGRKLEFMWLTSVNSVKESGGSENLSAASDKSPEANIEPSEENAPSHYQKTAALGSNE